MKKTAILTLIIIFVLSFLVRYNKNNLSSPFWVDEYSSAEQAKLLLKYGAGVFSQKNDYVEHHNFITHSLIAASFKLFGVNEVAARLPFVLLGSLVPVAAFLLVKRLVGFVPALISALLITFSYFEITWSLQARPYVLLQLLILLFFHFYLIFLEKRTDIKRIFPMAIIFAIGVLTHKYMLFVGLAAFLHFLALDIKAIINLIKDKKFLIVSSLILASLTVGLYKIGYFATFIEAVKTGAVGLHNNLWYYHSFLWRQYQLLVFLSIIGAFLLIKKSARLFEIASIYVVIHLFFITFIFAHYISKYTLPIFPFILIFAAVALTEIGSLIQKKLSEGRLKILAVMPISLLLCALIIISGDKFTLKPRIYYSVNHDMREIAVVNYPKVFELIKSKSGGDLSSFAMVDTWTARSQWYLGNDANIYLFRWADAGMGKNLSYQIDENGRKYLAHTNSPKIFVITELQDLIQAQEKFAKGFIWIDDTSLPADVVEYVKANFQKEIFVDHYELDDNPYSIWPATLYSWGFGQ